MGIDYLFPIQFATFNSIYNGKDIVGQDRTGSGKTLAFALPILEALRKKGAFKRRETGGLITVVVPTRELAT